MTTASNNVFTKVIGAEAAAPGTPSANTSIAYVKADGLWYSKDDAGTETLMSGGAGGAPTTADYLTGTAQGGLSAEIVVGTTPGGELGGTWASPTVDTTHSGSPHILQAASYKRTSADYTTSSATFVDIDGTNASFTITTGARRVMMALAGSCYHSAANGSVAFDVTVDGTRQGGDVGVVFVQGTTANHPMNCSFVYITDALSAGSHVFKFQWLTSGATASLAGQASGGSGIVVRFAVTELPNA